MGNEMTGDEHLYLAATEEAESEAVRDPALWAKCMALSDGAGDKAKYMYINERVEALKAEEAEVLHVQKQRAEEKEKERLNSIVQDLKNIKCFASENENGSWTVYGPGDDVRTFKTHNGFLSFAQELLPNIKIEQSKIDKKASFKNPGQEIHSDIEEKPFFQKLANGDFGLAKTYWIYGVLVGVVANILSNIITSINGLIIFMVLYTAYEIPVLMGIWRASDKYQGPSAWAVLAKIAVVLGAIMLVIGFLAIAGLLNHA